MPGTTRKLLYAALMLGVAGCVSSDRNVKIESGTVKTIRVKGMARYSVDQDEWNPMERGIQFRAGVLIQTGPKALVDLCMNDGHPSVPQDGSEKTSAHVIRIFENSALQIDKLTKQESREHFSEDIELDLRAGQIMVSVGTLFPESSYIIKMPDERVEVRGGEFMVGGVAINVLKGAVSAVRRNADGSETRIEIGSRQSFDPGTGKVTPLPLQQVSHYYVLDGPVCGQPLPQPPLADASTNLGVPHGDGMGHALRKFP